MPRPLYIVDAFTDRPFSGNPAAVVLLEPEDGPASDEYMQNVARELNLSETAFVGFDEALGANRVRLRWFTSVCEVELCGHATLASAQVLYDAARVNLHTPILFETRGGVLRAAPDADFGGFTLDFPATPPVEAAPPEGLFAALNLEAEAEGNVRFVGRSPYDWFVVLDDAASIRGLTPDLTRLARIPARGVIVTAPGADDELFDVVSRCFYPGYGIDEDSVTGSAHCAIAPYFARTTGRDRFHCHQASPRGGELVARVENDRVFLSGKARSVVRGELLV